MTKTDELYAKAGLATNTLVVLGCLCAPNFATAQPPELSKGQRALLQAVVQAVDAAAKQPAVPDASWPAHVMRASDGSHYVAFSLEPAGDAKLPPGPILLYVRLATATGDAVTTVTERSAIRDWLVGRKIDPRLLPSRGIAIGEMPAFGAGGIAVRGSSPTTGSTDMKIMAMERERARAEQEARDKQRRAELAGKAMGLREVLPFEDFDLAATATAADGTRQISRAFTAGPGSYDLFVGWADPAAATPAGTIRVLRRSLRLPPATTGELTLSSVVIADDVKTRAVPYPPAEQSAHPYTIGATEITPARDAVFTRDERLAVAFQVINARPSDTGKPDVGVSFRIVRAEAERELPVASLNPQSYAEASMPADFDLRLGHPLFVAVGAPLASVPRGSYRLKIAVTDRAAGVTRTADADFTIIGTPLSLLAEAPSLGRPFQREDALNDTTLRALVQSLTPATPSPALRRALDQAAARRFIELLVEDRVPEPDQAARTALTALALYTIGDASALVQLQRAQSLGAPGGPIDFLIGAVRATQTRDADAIAAWQAAQENDWPAVTPFLIDAHLRRGEAARASVLVATALAGHTADGSWSRLLAATHLATERDADAVVVLEAWLKRTPDDKEAQWLLLQALYGQLVRNNRGDRDRFTRAAEAYITSGGANAALAAEWLKALPS